MAPCNPVGCLLSSTVFLSTYFSATNAQLEDTDRPEVTTLQGTLVGITTVTRHGRNISSFLGIPYAQPPTGKLRFAPPVAAGGWKGILNASTDSSMCLQVTRGALRGDEDCLYMNVYTPQLPRDKNSSLLPVMVYIHGGAFKIDSQASSILGPGYLLDKDVVLAVPNYRLNAFGFLSTGDEVAPGNWGLKDQVLALEWVQNNIQYFGGDRGRVTLFGQSAGASCVGVLSLSEATIGLFHRYITQSGSALGKWVYRPRAAYSSRAFELGKYVGCSQYASISLISCLRTVNASSIIAMDSKLSVTGSYLELLWGLTDEPDVKGAVLTDSPRNLFASGKIRDLPLITGVVRDEGLLGSREFYEDRKELDNFLENFDAVLPYMLDLTYEPDCGASWVSALKSYYLNNDLTTNRSLILSNLTLLFGDALFTYPVYDALRKQHVLAKSPQYFYAFDYQGPYSFSNIASGSTYVYGVDHADDLVYLFPSRCRFRNLSKIMTERDFKMVDTMVELWTSFAIDGTPTSSALNGTVKWEPYSIIEDNYLRIGKNFDVALEVEHSFLKERMAFWAGLDGIKGRMKGDYFRKCVMNIICTIGDNRLSLFGVIEVFLRCAL